MLSSPERGNCYGRQFQSKRRGVGVTEPARRTGGRGYRHVRAAVLRARGIGGLRALAPAPGGERLGRAHLARGVRRCRAERRGGESRQSRHPQGRQHEPDSLPGGDGCHHGRPDPAGVRHPGAVCAAPAGHGQRRGALVPGIVRTQCRFRPGVAGDPCRAG